ncbi:MAG: hypothetical protein WDA27_01850 [Actinomycetota bacterium]
MAAYRQTETLTLDCSDCPGREADACDGCLVSYVLDCPAGAVIFDVDEERALRSLRDGGLLPGVRLDLLTG